MSVGMFGSKCLHKILEFRTSFVYRISSELTRSPSPVDRESSQLKHCDLQRSIEQRYQYIHIISSFEDDWN